MDAQTHTQIARACPSPRALCLAFIRTCPPYRLIEDPLSDALLVRKVPRGCTLLLDLDPATGEPVVVQNKECFPLDSGEVVITHSLGGGPTSNNVVEYTSHKATPARASFMKAATRVK